MFEQIFHTIIIIVCFAMFDALVGGGIAASMEKTGQWNQTVNNFYQLGFSIGMAVILLILFFSIKWKIETFAVLILLFGFVEDTLYYVFIPLVNKTIKILSHGAEYHAFGGRYVPRKYFWVGRMDRA